MNKKTKNRLISLAMATEIMSASVIGNAIFNYDIDKNMSTTFEDVESKYKIVQLTEEETNKYFTLYYYRNEWKEYPDSNFDNYEEAKEFREEIVNNEFISLRDETRYNKAKSII